MPDVRVMIASRPYTVTCQPGEEAHLARLGEMVDDMARKAAGPSSSLTENRTLLFAALLLADQLADARDSENSTGSKTKETGSAESIHPDDDRSAVAIEHLAERIEKLASTLEEMTATP